MDMLDELLKTVSVDRIATHIRSLAGVRHPLAAPAALLQAACYIRDCLASFGCCMSEQRFEDGGASFANVIGTLAGTRFPEERVMVLAHFDTVAASPGADDSASGVAVLLELAAILSRCRFERSVQFIAVNLEENAGEDVSGAGIRGSRALAGLARESGWDIAGVLVLESVGYAGEQLSQRAPAGIPVEVPKKGNFLAVIGNEYSRGLVQSFGRAIERHRIALPYLSLVVPGNGELLPDTRRSDHAPFWDNGYRAVLLTDTTDFRNPHYHQPSDTFETLNLPFAAEVCRGSGALVMELAGAYCPGHR